MRLKERELQKSLFDYIGAGTRSPQFLINKLYEEENKKLQLEFINLDKFYKKKDTFSDTELNNFIEKNKDQLKVEYMDLNYIVINPKNLIGINEFNQSFFDKIDQIEIDIANGIQFSTISSNLDIPTITKKNFKISTNANEIEKKIFELRNIELDIFENNDDYILYEVQNLEERKPDITDIQTKNEVKELIFQKNKYEYNRKLIEKISKKEFNNQDFLKMAEKNLETTKLNSIKDNKKFEINAVEVLYSLPVNSFTLINDEQENIYLAKVKKFENKLIDENNEKYKEYINKQNSNIKNNMLKSYDFYLNDKYKINLNKKTIERVKNYFQ